MPANRRRVQVPPFAFKSNRNILLLMSGGDGQTIAASMAAMLRRGSLDAP
jgi:hypothetical protein